MLLSTSREEPVLFYKTVSHREKAWVPKLGVWTKIIKDIQDHDDVLLYSSSDSQGEASKNTKRR